MKTITAVIMLFVVVVLIGWDIFVAVHPPTGDTISEIIRHTATKYPIIPFVLGVLIGHWFWTN